MGPRTRGALLAVLLVAFGAGVVVAMLVRADHAALAGLAHRDGVRAVHAAQPGTPPQGLALAPLLPQQWRVAGPVPDDGPVP